LRPLTELELTADGLQFLRSDSLPVRSRTVKVWHHYDPISDEIKPHKMMERVSAKVISVASVSLIRL
jgi:hypothetical protein